VKGETVKHPLSETVKYPLVGCDLHGEQTSTKERTSNSTFGYVFNSTKGCAFTVAYPLVIFVSGKAKVFICRLLLAIL